MIHKSGQRRSRTARRCLNCDKSFFPVWAGKSGWSEYCGRSCASKSVIGSRSIGITSAVVFGECVACGVIHGGRGKHLKDWCSKRCLADIQKAKRLSRKPPVRVEHRCVVCGSVYFSNRSQSKLCSLPCTRKFYKRRLRLSFGDPSKYRSHVQRAKRAGVQYENVSRIVVFKGDHWTCYICGKATPRELIRDFRHPDAPTLDHIIPLSKGGAHLYTNTRCACRDCNSRKSSDVPPVYFTRGYWKGETPPAWSGPFLVEGGAL